MKLNHEQGHPHIINPYFIMRKDGSWIFSQPIVSYVSGLFNQTATATMVGNINLIEEEQVKSGILEALHVRNNNLTYVGVIEQLPMHMIGWVAPQIKEGPRFKVPLHHLNKSHIVDLVYKFGIEYLFEITHSCIFPEIRCNNCNGCNERAWGFEQLGRIDTGRV